MLKRYLSLSSGGLDSILVERREAIAAWAKKSHKSSTLSGQAVTDDSWWHEQLASNQAHPQAAISNRRLIRSGGLYDGAEGAHDGAGAGWFDLGRCVQHRQGPDALRPAHWQHRRSASRLSRTCAGTPAYGAERGATL